MFKSILHLCIFLYNLDISNLKKNYYVDVIFLFYLFDVCSYLSKLWAIVSTPYYLVVIQSDKEKKQNQAQAKILQKEWWFVITTTIIFK